MSRSEKFLGRLRKILEHFSNQVLRLAGSQLATPTEMVNQVSASISGFLFPGHAINIDYYCQYRQLFCPNSGKIFPITPEIGHLPENVAGLSKQLLSSYAPYAHPRHHIQWANSSMPLRDTQERYGLQLMRHHGSAEWIPVRGYKPLSEIFVQSTSLEVLTIG